MKYSYFNIKPWLVLAALALLLAACGDSSPTAIPTTASSGSSGTNSLPAPATSAGITAITRNSSPTPGQVRLTTSAAQVRKADGQIVNMTVELAKTPQEQETGLMGRKSLPADTGMLFVFNSVGRISFWMKDTPLALSIAFIGADGTIVDIQDMQPFSEEIIRPKKDHLYALEVTQGYFSQKGIKEGDLFKLTS